MMNSPRRRALLAALGFALVFPSLVTAVYFLWLRSWPAGVQQVAYAAGKLIQFGFPLAWVLCAEGRRLAWPRVKIRGIGAGTAFGLLVAAAVLALYFGFLHGSTFMEGPAEQVRRKVGEFGVSDLAAYAALGIFYAIAH